MYYVPMLLLFLLFVSARAEWPPTSCGTNAVIQNNRVQMTSESNEISLCNIAELYEDEAYVSIARFYKNNMRKYKHAMDSKVVITISDTSDNELFDVEVHSDKIQAEKNRCFGIFQSVQPFDMKIQVHSFFDLQKTVVGISTSKGGRGFKSCFQFEIDKVVGKFKLTLRAFTQSGMEQWVHGIRNAPATADSPRFDNARVETLEKDVRNLKVTMRHLSEKIAQNNIQQDQHIQEVDSKHRELKRHLKTSISRNNESVRHYSYFSFSMFILLCIFGFAAVKFTQHYIRKRDKIF